VAGARVLKAREEIDALQERLQARRLLLLVAEERAKEAQLEVGRISELARAGAAAGQGGQHRRSRRRTRRRF